MRTITIKIDIRAHNFIMRSIRAIPSMPDIIPILINNTRIIGTIFD